MNTPFCCIARHCFFADAIDSRPTAQADEIPDDAAHSIGAEPLVQPRSGNFLQLLRAGFRRWDLYWPRQVRKGWQRPREPAAGDD
jgi:hypothetical protein